MQRTKFLQTILGLFTVSPLLASTKKTNNTIDACQIRTGIVDALKKSQEMTMKIVEQMPNEFFRFKYTPEAMSFAEQFRHCAVYSFSQFAGRLGVINPFEGKKPKVDMNKEETLAITKQMYDTLLQWTNEISEEKLMAEIEFSGESMPAWRFFYAMENHIIHHRGQAIVYLRLKGVTPKGYFGW
jgi:uncharacterized damage-inducible protein DinB